MFGTDLFLLCRFGFCYKQCGKMNLQLPSVEKRMSIGGKPKNEIYHFIESPQQIEFKSEITRISKDSIILTTERDDSYCFTVNPSEVPSEVKYALLLTKRPTDQAVLTQQLQIKKWIKHPKGTNFQHSDVLKSWENSFHFIEEVPEKSSGLRIPQIAALYSILSHLRTGTETATVVMPTGTGKTETMMSALIANNIDRLLITVPSDALRQQISSKFASLGLLKTFGIVDSTVLNPIIGTLSQKYSNIEDLTQFLNSCNVIVSTIQLVASFNQEEINEIDKKCKYIFIDEAHHIKAESWAAFKDCFSPTKIFQFTATPFRNDGKKLDGRIIFNFTLKQAQDQGYFKTIEFIHVREYNPQKADKIISENAIKKLRQDLKDGYHHILMARCKDKKRAQEIFNKYYSTQTDLNPVLLFSGIKDRKLVFDKILKKSAKIIVCVDMLGEGFDLPQLKIAAFHDIRKSLPITLQFAGRFTRTSLDKTLGQASFIANIAAADVNDELSDLYAKDSNWNKILSDISYEKTKKEMDFYEVMSHFPNLANADIPFRNIKPKLSTVVYRNQTSGWNPKNFKQGIPDFDDCSYKFFDINFDDKLLVVITAREQPIDWVKAQNIFNLQWQLILIYWDTKNNLLFINSSDNSSLYRELATAIIGEDAELYSKINVFKAFYNIKRTRLLNVGLRYFVGKDIRYRMSVGYDVAEALSRAEKEKGEKAFVIGIGYEDGELVNIGCSYKGRIWTRLVGNLPEFKEWCNRLGAKLVNENIDPNQILKETLIPILVSERPTIMPVWIDWDSEIYNNTEDYYSFDINGSKFELSNVELQLIDASETGNIKFAIKTEELFVIYALELFVNKTRDTPFPDFKISNLSGESVLVRCGSKEIDSVVFFQTFIPTIWFANGDALSGNEFVALNGKIDHYQKENIIVWNWDGIDLSKESQGVSPKLKNSIQYRTIEILKQQDFDFIYDDDNSGEIADVIAMKQLDDKIKVNLYHLKYATEGIISNRIDNLYTVCGQAQKSIRWKYRSGKEFFDHLFKRMGKTKKGERCQRLEKGTFDELEVLSTIAKKKIPMEFEIFLVQPSIDSDSVSDDILTLLGVTETFIKDVSKISFKVIGNSSIRQI